MEWVRRTTAIMAGAEYGHLIRLLLHPVECHMFRAGDARFGRTGMFSMARTKDLVEC